MIDLQIAIVRELHRNDSIQFKLDGIAQAAHALRGADVGLLVAPEYHFRNWWSQDARSAHVTKSEKDSIKGALIDLSLGYPNVILIPGTVAWKEPASDRTDLLQRIAQTGPNYFASTNNREIGAPVKYMAVSLQSQTNLQFVPNVLYNTAYLYHDGWWCGIDKEGDFQESSYGGVLVHEKGTLTRDFNVNGRSIWIGLEICLDHAMGRLRNSGADEVDVHVILSDFVSNDPSRFHVRPGGAVVHASTVGRSGVGSDRFEYHNWNPDSGWQLWDNRTMTYRSKSTVSPVPGRHSTTRTTSGFLPPMTYSAYPAQHDKRVTNVFVRQTTGYKSGRVSHQFGHFYTVTQVRLS